MGDFSAEPSSTTPLTSLRYERQSESWKLFSHLRRLKKVCRNTFCPKMSAKIQIIMTRMQLQQALTMTKRIRLKSALQTRKKVDLPKQRETTEAILIRTKVQIDRGRTPLMHYTLTTLFYSSIHVAWRLFSPNGLTKISARHRI